MSKRHPLPAMHKSTRKGEYRFDDGLKGGHGGLMGHDTETHRPRSWWERICYACFTATRGVYRGKGDERTCARCGRAYATDGWA